jgi:hypothetical protein
MTEMILKSSAQPARDFPVTAGLVLKLQTLLDFADLFVRGDSLNKHVTFLAPDRYESWRRLLAQLRKAKRPPTFGELTRDFFNGKGSTASNALNRMVGMGLIREITHGQRKAYRVTAIGAQVSEEFTKESLAQSARPTKPVPTKPVHTSIEQERKRTAAYEKVFSHANARLNPEERELLGLESADDSTRSFENFLDITDAGEQVLSGDSPTGAHIR